VFWGTTYSFELELFDEYLFRRLGDPPLNATLLVDFATLARTWAGIQPGEEWRVQQVNRQYLVRPAGTSHGRFHPKTYFFANDKEATLLVGSGNLSMPGLEEGHEVFCRFDSSNPDGLAAILSWRDWMQLLVEEAKDELMHQRWIRLRQTTHVWMKGSAKPSVFVTNSEFSILDQFLNGSETGADELHATAPFYDRDCAVIETILDRTRPRKLFLYLGQGTNVAGAALRQVLERSPAEVSIVGFEPSRFVHAKLVAVIYGERARLLSGSANLSRAALISTLREHSWANTEAGVISDTTADVVREVFKPPGLELMAISLDSLVGFSYEDPESEPSLPIRLLAATPTDDGSVEIMIKGATQEDVYLTSANQTVRIKETRTVEMFPLTGKEVLVWLTDEKGNSLSNRIPIDDPLALRNQLETRTSRSSDRPRELDASDLDSPIARILAQLHNDYIFDLDEIEVIKQAERANDDPSQATSEKFWERLAKEELQMDPRAGAYRRLSNPLYFEDDELLLLLRMMLDRTPQDRHSFLAPGPEPIPPEEARPGRSWAPTQRLQSRLMNVLTRWSRALADPRMNWLQPFSAVRNFQALLYALAELWELKALPEAKLFECVNTLFGNFVRSEEGEGYYFQVAGQDRENALQRLSPEGRDVAAAVVYLGFQPKTTWKDRIFEWQVWLTPCLDDGIVVATERAAGLASRIGGDHVSQAELSSRLRWASEYIDDSRWCTKMVRLTGVEGIRFSTQSFPYGIVIEVDSVDLVDHPGMVHLLRNALEFRRADGIVIMSGPERIAIRLGQMAYGLLSNGDVLESTEQVTEALLILMEESGLPLREIFTSLEESHGAAS
jgi:hypothetical protein